MVHGDGNAVAATHEPAVARTTVTATPAGGRTRILVVEDEQDIATLIKHALEKMGGVEVDVVESGDAAIRQVASGPTSSFST